MTQSLSAFDRYVRESTARIVATLREYGFIDPTSGEERPEMGYLIDNAPTLGTGYEYLGDPEKARVYYRLGMNKWPQPARQYRPRKMETRSVAGERHAGCDPFFRTNDA